VGLMNAGTKWASFLSLGKVQSHDIKTSK